jgi:hypothetical protein
MTQTDNKDDFPDARPLPHLANANGDAGGIMKTETASTTIVEDGNGHIPSDVSMAGLGLSDQKNAARRDHAHRHCLQNL